MEKRLMVNHRGSRFLVAAVAILAAVSSPIAQSSREAVPPGRAVGGGVPRAAGAGQHPRVQRAPERPAAPRRLAVRQGQRRVDPGAVQGMGLGRADRALRRPLSRRRRTRLLEMVAPTRFVAKLEEPAVAADPTSGPEGRAAAHLQRLLGRRRRDGAARLRQLRPARGLRAARPARHLGEGRDRHRALRRLVARHQAEGRRRARRRRVPHLLRSARRRVLRGRGVPGRTDAAARRRAARQRHGHAGLPGRPAHAGRRRDARGEATRR